MNNEQVQEIFVEDIIPNRFQPRLTFDEKALQELADSIKVHGIIQPLVLRKVGNRFEIIAGERRYKAACLAGLKKVPAIVRELTDNESAEVALIENIQRRNLTSIEEAQSYRNILDRGYLTQDDLAKKLGVSQSSIANKMRLLNLSDEVQDALLNEQISERHARSLLQLNNLDDQKKMLNKVIKERLTVKQLDDAIKKQLGKINETTESEEEMMNPVMDNEKIDTPQKNIFGLTVDVPVDLEKTAPNLDTDVQDEIPPVSFNPFSNNSVNDSQVNYETIETFDMFGDVVSTPVQNDLYVENKEVTKPSIGEQINSIRNTIHMIENNGYIVEVEDYDFEDVYQIIIKIKK